MSTRRFRNSVFVFQNAAAELVTDNTKTPYDLTSGQIGIFTSTRDARVGVGTGATPSPANNPFIEVHQNVGDNRHGTLRTKPMHVDQVVEYRKSNPQTALPQILHLGYDEADANKNLVVPAIDAGEAYAEVHLTFIIHSKRAVRLVYGNNFRKTITVRVTAADTPSTFADKIIAAFNATNTRALDIEAGNDLKAYITASKVTTGVAPADVYGVKFTTVAISEPAMPIAEQQLTDIELISFTVSSDFTNSATGTMEITETQAARTGQGWAAQVAMLEREAQGYNRVRETFGAEMYHKLSKFITRAQFGTKYDGIYLDYNWTHDTPGGHPQTITEPYTLAIFAPTGTLQATANVFNSWLAGKKAAVTL